MPTSTRRGAVGLSLLEQERFPASYRPDDVMIGTWSRQAIGDLLVECNSLVSNLAYPAASRVLAYPFELCDDYLVRKVWWFNGTTATTDSCDVGVYSESGGTLHVSGGSTAIATADVVQEKDCTDTLLLPGRYWCAYVQGGTTATPRGYQPSAAYLRTMGCAQMAGSGSTLGSTFTPAASVSGTMPIFGIAGRTQVA